MVVVLTLFTWTHPLIKIKLLLAPIDSNAKGASFKDYFREEDVKDEWLETIKEDNIELYNFLTGVKEISSNKYYLYNYCYLCYLAIRLIEMQRILKDTGSLYLHCDPTMSHYIKLLMDIIFGEKNFRNEIIWYYPNKQPSKSNFFLKSNDIIFYSKTNHYTFNLQFRPGSRVFKDIEKGYARATRFQNGKKIISLRVYDLAKLELAIQQKKVNLEEFDEQRDYTSKTGSRPMENVFTINIINSQSKERTGYPTQKPLALLERIIKASSNENDIVLDPFCGCATTCIASERLNRQWVGIDVSQKAYELVKERLTQETDGVFDFTSSKKSGEGKGVEVFYTHTPPERTDGQGQDVPLKKYVYVISNPAFENMYKVGVASDCKARLNSYQTSDPDRGYRLEYQKHTNLFRKIEKHIHEKFENKHEWVRSNLKEIIDEIESYK